MEDYCQTLKSGIYDGSYGKGKVAQGKVAQ